MVSVLFMHVDGHGLFNGHGDLLDNRHLDRVRLLNRHRVRLVYRYGIRLRNLHFNRHAVRLLDNVRLRNVYNVRLGYLNNVVDWIRLLYLNGYGNRHLFGHWNFLGYAVILVNNMRYGIGFWYRHWLIDRHRFVNRYDVWLRYWVWNGHRLRHALHHDVNLRSMMLPVSTIKAAIATKAKSEITSVSSVVSIATVSSAKAAGGSESR